MGRGGGGAGLGQDRPGQELPGAALTAEMMSEVFNAMCWTPAPP